MVMTPQRCDGIGMFQLRANSEAPESSYDGKNSDVRTTRIKLDWNECVGVIESGAVAMDYTDDNSAWCGGTVDDLKQSIRCGDRKIVEASEKVLTEVNAKLQLPTPGAVPELSLIGGTPNMSAYYAGSPACMNGLDDDAEDDNGLVRIICDTSTSWSINDDLIFKRAAAVTALVRSISMYRPTEFWVASCGKVRMSGNSRDDSACMVRVSAHPVDISAVGAAMSQNFSRRFCYGVEYSSMGCDTYDDAHGLGWPEKHVAGCIGIGGYGNKDIIVPPLHSDREAEYAEDPAKWVKEQVELAVLGKGQAHELIGASN